METTIFWCYVSFREGSLRLPSPGSRGGFQEDQALQLSQLRAHAVKKSEENDAPVDTNEILGANKHKQVLGGQ